MRFACSVVVLVALSAALCCAATVCPATRTSYHRVQQDMCTQVYIADPTDACVKQRLVTHPEICASYDTGPCPATFNALTTACKQATCRDARSCPIRIPIPVMRNSVRGLQTSGARPRFK